MATQISKKKIIKKGSDDPQEVIKTRSELYKFKDGLEAAPKVGAKFQYAVSRNLRRINAEIEDMEKVVELNEKMKEYQKQVDELNRKYTPKDEFGKYQTMPRIINKKKVDVLAVKGKDVEGSAYEKELAKIRKEFQEEIDIHEKKVEEYNEFLKEECSWDPYMINLTDVPDQAGPVIDDIIYMIRNVQEL